MHFILSDGPLLVPKTQNFQNWTDKMQGLGIMSKKKTHAPRGSGACDTYELK